jgi:hypothetical protein
MGDPRTTAAKLTAQFHGAFGDELKSVVVFGSVPRGEAIPGVSDLNVLVLLAAMPATTLVRAAPLLLQWIRQGNTPPHMYSWEEWSGMQDTFAIEIADMNDAREVMWGADPVSANRITYESLRMQAEREARDTLLHLRLRLMVNANSPPEIGSLLLSGFPSFTAYMRAALRLRGETPGIATRAVVERMAEVLDIDPTPMLTCYDARRSRELLNVPLTDPLVERYMGFVRALLQHLNDMPTERSVTRETPQYHPSPSLGLSATLNDRTSVQP